jgi:hypothetical protein
MIKSLKKLRIEEMYLNIIKVIYNKPIVNITLNSKQDKAVHSTLFQYSY